MAKILQKLKKEILSLLQSSDKPIKRKYLLTHLKIVCPDITDREMRSEIERMITMDGELIESSHLGYSLIRTNEEKERAKKYLQEKISALCIRRNSLEKNWINNVLSGPDKKNQLNLF